MHSGAQLRGSAKNYLNRLTSLLSALDAGAVDDAVKLIYDTWVRGNQVITLGNGGSAVTALHFITDWNKSPYLKTGRSFRGRTLIDNMGLVMAYANDMGFENVFSEQLKNIAVAGDLVIAISGSGNSENVIRAVHYANSVGCHTIGLCGFSGGRLKDAAQHLVWARVDDMQLCEDVHAIFGHIVMQALCSMASQ
jgi:D-sedoheptulose 7-phosphate isomerase